MAWLISLALCCFLAVQPAAAATDQYYILLPVNINTADALTLSRALKGVGPAKAQAIVEYRQLHGDFKSVNDLKSVKGIGPGTLMKNRGRITVVQDLF